MINEEDQFEKRISTPLRLFGSIMTTSAKVSTISNKAHMAVKTSRTA